MEELKIVYKYLKDLKPYENNPRNNDDAVEKVAESIKQFGFKVPLVVDKDNVIVAGHTRYKACLQLNISKVPCIIADDLTEQQVKAFRLADNKVGEIAGWNFAKLDLELDGLMDFDMSKFGFDIDFCKDFDDEKETEEVEIPEQIVSMAKAGDIWQLGKHRLMCGDSTSTADVEKLMNGVKADLLITDPPYNVNYEGKSTSKLKIKNDNLNNDDFRKFLKSAFSAANAVMKEGGYFTFGTQVHKL